MAYAKNLREQLPRLAMDLQGIVDKAKNDGNRGLTAEEREKFHKLEADYSSIEDSINIAEKSESIVDELAKSPGSKVSETQVEALRDEFRTNPKSKSPHDKAFGKFMRYGLSALDADEKKLMNYVPHFQNAQTTTTTAGGYLVPTGFSQQLEEAKLWFGGIAGVVDIFRTDSGQPLNWPTTNDTANKGRIIGQNVQVTETDFAFNQVTFNAFIGSSDLVLIPLALIQDAYFDMDALTARLLGTRLGRLYNWKCTSGVGTTEPTGIVTAAVAAASVYTCAAGTSNVGRTTIYYNDLVELQHKVDPSYRTSSAKWMFNDTTLKGLKQLVDKNDRPLWMPGLTASFREGAGVDTIKPTILDHQYVINQDMDAPAASKYTMLFGDMSSFKVREAGGTTVLRLAERYADYCQVGFVAFQRFDSNLIDAGTHPIAVLRQAA